MKKNLILLLLSLITLTTSAQTFKIQKVKRIKADRSTERGTSRRNMDLYQTPTSDLTYINAINARTVAMTTVAGTVIPALHGNAPYIQAARYTYTAGRNLTVDVVPAAGANLELSVALVSGQALTLQSLGGQALFANTFYSPGTQGGQGAFTKEWTLHASSVSGSGIPPAPVKITFRNAGGSDYTYTFTPVVGVHQALTGGAVGGNTSPPPSTTVNAPNWLSARYTWAGNRLDVEGAPVNSSGVTLNIKRADGQDLLIQSSGGQVLTTTDFYPSGPLSGQGSFVQEWSFTPRSGGGVPQVPIVLTFRKPDGTSFAHTFTPALATRQTLFTASGGATTPPTSTTAYLTYTRGVAVGNSITRTSYQGNFSGTNQTIVAGMAASAESKDYVHVMETALKVNNPNFVLAAKNQGAGLEGVYKNNNDDVVNTIANLLSELRQDYGQGVDFDLLLISISENINDAGFDAVKFRAMLDRLISEIPKKPGCTIVLRTSFWIGHTASNNFIRSYVAEKGYKLAELSDIEERADLMASSNVPPQPMFSNPDVAKHPGDAGMIVIAQKFLDQLKTNSTTTPPTGTTTAAPTSGYGNIYAANSTYTPRSETTRPSGTATGQAPFARSFLDNGTLKVGINLSVGGATDFIAWDGGKNIVNGPIHGNGKMDAGRQWSYTWYSNPNGAKVSEGGEGPYTEAGQSTANAHPVNGQVDPNAGSIGWNPVEPGDEGGNPTYSPILIHHNSGSELYKKVQGMQWDLRGIPGKAYTESWFKFDPSNARAVRVHARVSLFRDDAFASLYPTPRQQEGPCFYTVLDYNRFFYCIGQPYGSGTAGLTERVIDGSTQQQPFVSTEPAVYAYNQTRNRYYVLYAPFSGRFTAGVFDTGYGTIGTTNAENFTSAYVASAPIMSLDPRGVYDFDNALFEGSLAECRAWVAAQPRWDGLPDYTFTNKSRLGWYHHHGKDQLEANMTDGMAVRPLDNSFNNRDFKAQSPEKWINARVVKKIYVTAGFQSSSPQKWFNWKKAGDSNDYRVQFTVNPSGAVQKYTIDLEGNPNWNNQDIVQIWISNVHDGSSYPDASNDVFTIKKVTHLNNSLDDWSLLLLISLGAGTLVNRQRRKRVVAIRTNKGVAQNGRSLTIKI